MRRSAFELVSINEQELARMYGKGRFWSRDAASTDPPELTTSLARKTEEDVLTFPSDPFPSCSSRDIGSLFLLRRTEYGSDTWDESDVRKWSSADCEITRVFPKGERVPEMGHQSDESS